MPNFQLIKGASPHDPVKCLTGANFHHNQMTVTGKVGFIFMKTSRNTRLKMSFHRPLDSVIHDPKSQGKIPDQNISNLHVLIATFFYQDMVSPDYIYE